jgi:hypothetical protein
VTAGQLWPAPGTDLGAVAIPGAERGHEPVDLVGNAQDPASFWALLDPTELVAREHAERLPGEDEGRDDDNDDGDRRDRECQELDPTTQGGGGCNCISATSYGSRLGARSQAAALAEVAELLGREPKASLQVLRNR